MNKHGIEMNTIARKKPEKYVSLVGEGPMKWLPPILVHDCFQQAIKWGTRVKPAKTVTVVVVSGVGGSGGGGGVVGGAAAVVKRAAADISGSGSGG